MKAIHKLKTWPEYFYAVRGGCKPFEIRNNDRDFKVGDVLILQCYLPSCGEFNGEEEAVEVTYITDFAQKENHVVMGIKRL